ncbi:hypothetical protein ABZ061_32770 [Streptomyces mutabilis]
MTLPIQAVSGPPVSDVANGSSYVRPDPLTELAQDIRQRTALVASVAD